MQVQGRREPDAGLRPKWPRESGKEKGLNHAGHGRSTWAMLESLKKPEEKENIQMHSLNDRSEGMMYPRVNE